MRNNSSLQKEWPKLQESYRLLDCTLILLPVVVDDSGLSLYYMSKQYHYQNAVSNYPEGLPDALVHSMQAFVHSPKPVHESQPQQPQQSASTIPRITSNQPPKNRSSSFLHGKRRGGTETNEDTRTNRFKLGGGVEYVKDLLFMFSSSVDGVQVFSSSIDINSVYVFSLFSENVMRRHTTKGLDCYFGFIVPCNKGTELLEIDQVTGSIRPPVVSESTKDSFIDGNTPGISPTRLVSHSLDGLTFLPGKPEGRTNPSDSNFREILSLVLNSMKEFGKRGFCIRYGKTLLCIRYAIVVFRADIPAHNLLLDSSGRYRSNYPCTKCDFHIRSYDPLSMMYMDGTSVAFSKFRANLRSYNSAFAGLAEDDYLRTLPAIAWIRHEGNDESSGHQKKDQFERVVFNGTVPAEYERAKSVLTRLLDFIPCSPHVLNRVEDYATHNYDATSNPYTPSNHPCTKGKVNMEKNTFLSYERSTSIDIMHMVHTLGPLYLLLIFGKKKKKTTTEASLDGAITKTNRTQTLNTLLNQSHVDNGICRKESSYNYMEVDDDILSFANYRYQRMSRIPKMYQKTLGDLFSDDPSFDAKGDDKMVICFALLPYLLIDSMDDPKVWCVVNFFILLSCIFNHDGPYSEACVYQLLIRVVLYVLEMHTSPTLSSLYSHSSLHLDTTYVDSGPLKGTDTMHGERQYCGLSSQATGGPKPVLTVSRRDMLRRASCLIMHGIEAEEAETRPWGGCQISQQCSDLRISQSDYIIKRSIINMLSDEHRLYNDLHPHFSFTDLEFCGGVEPYLNGNWKMQYSSLRGDSFWATSNETVIRFFKDNQYTDTGKYCSDDIQVVYSFSSGGHMYQAMNCRPQDMEANSFQRNSFAVVYTMNRRIHLLGIRRYIALKEPSSNKIYMQALVFEIPIQPVTPLVDSPFCFKVDLTQLRSLRPCYTLVSFHRLYIMDLHFIPSCNNELYGALLKTCIRQWSFFDDVFVSVTANANTGQQSNDASEVINE